MRIPLPKRLATLSLATTAAIGLAAASAAAVGPELPLRGEGTYCLSTQATEAMASTGITLESTGEATRNGTCVTLPGSGTLSTDLFSGEIPLRGGMRFSTDQHRLDVTNLRLHVGSRTTSADVSIDGAPATQVDFLHYTITPTNVSVGMTTVEARSVGLRLTEPGAAAFTQAFTSSPVTANHDLFTFNGNARFTNPLG